MFEEKDGDPDKAKESAVISRLQARPSQSTVYCQAWLSMLVLQMAAVACVWVPSIGHCVMSLAHLVLCQECIFLALTHLCMAGAGATLHHEATQPAAGHL